MNHRIFLISLALFHYFTVAPSSCSSNVLVQRRLLRHLRHRHPPQPRRRHPLRLLPSVRFSPGLGVVGICITDAIARSRRLGRTRNSSYYIATLDPYRIHTQCHPTGCCVDCCGVDNPIVDTHSGCVGDGSCLYCPIGPRPRTDSHRPRTRHSTPRQM